LSKFKGGEMANIWDDIVKWLEDASKVVGREAGDLTLKGRLKVEIFELNRRLRDSYTDLGNLVYDEFFIKKNDRWPINLKVKSLVRKIKAAQRQLKRKYSEYKKVGDQKTSSKSKK
jgi:hypothetical protein